MLRDLCDRIYSKALWLYIAADIWFFHKSTAIEEFFDRRN